MTFQAILAPLFVQVLLVFILTVWMGQSRGAAVRAGDVRKEPGSPRGFGWPDRAQKVSDCFHNQLELPVLFYVAVIIGLVTKQADLIFVTLSWVFVVTRYLHAFEHTSRNRIRWRFGFYAAGVVALFVMWLILALKLFTGL